MWTSLCASTGKCDHDKTPWASRLGLDLASRERDLKGACRNLALGRRLHWLCNKDNDEVLFGSKLFMRKDLRNHIDELANLEFLQFQVWLAARMCC